MASIIKIPEPYPNKCPENELLGINLRKCYSGMQLLVLPILISNNYFSLIFR